MGESELREVVPKPTPVAKERRCAEGLRVKTMLCDRSNPVHVQLARSELPSTPWTLVTVVPSPCHRILASVASADNYALFGFAITSPHFRHVIDEFVAGSTEAGLSFDDETNVRPTRNVCRIAASTACVSVGRTHTVGRTTEGFYDTALNEASDA